MEREYECDECVCKGCMKGDYCRCDDITCKGKAKSSCEEKID